MKREKRGFPSGEGAGTGRSTLMAAGALPSAVALLDVEDG
jgi:hypothetical protein